MVNDLHVFDSIPAYVLGSLEEQEARLVAEHLAGCHACRRELEAYQTVTDQLLLVLPEVDPPPGLKPRLMERVKGLNGRRIPESKVWRPPERLLPVGAFIGLLLILVLAVSSLVLGRQAANAEVITGPDGMRAIALQNTGTALGASGFVIVGADGKNGVLVVDKLPPLDETREYQAWLRRDSMDTSAAVFQVDEDGYRGMRLIAPESLLNYASVQVTIGPAGGSASPTGPQVLRGSLFNP
jgi:anti-sigma-K factor RskA